MNKVKATKLIRFIGYILVLIFLVMSIQANARQRRNISDTKNIAQDTQQIAQQLKDNNVTRDANVAKLLKSNDQQTLILCEIIIANNNVLPSKDITQIESICKQKISQVMPQPAPTTSQNFTSQSTSQSSNKQPTKNKPSNPPPQPRPVECSFNVLFVHLGCTTMQ